MMTIKADDRRRVQIPGIKPGQVFAYADNGDGSITLAPVRLDLKERAYNKHLYDAYPDERTELEAASARVDVSAEERDRR